MELSKTNIIWGVSALIGLVLLVSTLNNESEEMKYVVDANGFLTTFALNDDYPEACLNEYMSQIPDDYDAEELLEFADFKELVSKAHTQCPLEGILIAGKITMALQEAVRVPVNGTIPYELLKRSLIEEGNHAMRCSDRIKVMIKSCPELMKPYIKRISNSQK